VTASIGVVAALEREARLVRRAARAGGVDAAVWVACCGMGGERAAAAAGEGAARGVRVLISTGYAGALDPRLVPGDLLLASEVHASGSPAVQACDARTLVRATQALAGIAGVHRGALISVDRTLDDPGARRELSRLSGARAVDMESAAVAAVAARCGIPWLVLRAISDGVEQRLPPRLSALMDDRGNPTPGRALRALLRHPGDLRHLPSLARGARRADRGLEAALPLLLAALAGALP